MKFLLNQGAKVSHGMFIDVVENRDSVLFDLLFNESQEDVDLNDLLLRASQLGYDEMVEYLIQKGADNLNEVLIDALEDDDIEIIDVLLRNGAVVTDDIIELAKQTGDDNIITLVEKYH